MPDHKKILEAAEEAAKVVQDPELRKIAFQEIVRNELQKSATVDAPANEGTLGIPADAATPKPPRAKAQSRGSHAKGARDAVKKLDISPDEKDLPAWASMSQDWKKFCWILEAARLKGVDGLTAPEISYLIDQVFREHYAPRLMANLKKKIKGGFVRVIKVDVGGRQVAAWKVLSAGSTALKQAAVEVTESK